MPNIEKTLTETIRNKSNIFFIFVISTIGFYVRYVNRAFVSGDMSLFLIRWLDVVKDLGGVKALAYQVGNYNILYQTIICLFSYINLPCVYLYKILSCIFDYVLAIGAGLLGCQISWYKNRKFFVFSIIYAAVLILPTVIMNSSVWGQCDSIYTSFIIFSILFLIKKKYKLSFSFLGIAFAFKLQTIFILPFYIYCYFDKKDFSIFYFLLTVFIFWLSGLGAYLYGRSFFVTFEIYYKQTLEFSQLFLNYPSFWILVGDNAEVLKVIAEATSITLLGVGLLILLNKKEQMDNIQLLKIAAWTCWTAVLFMPSMHERYSFLIDILLFIITVIDLKALPFMLVEVVLSIQTYGFYLFESGEVTVYMSLMNTLIWSLYTYWILREEKRNVLQK